MVDHLDEAEEHEEQYLHHTTDHHYPTGHHYEHANRFDFEHTEPEVDHSLDTKHVEHVEHFNELEWDTMHHTAAVSGDMHCPEGFSKVGCCRCVHDLNPQQHHILGAEHRDLAPTIHGMPTHHEENNS